MQLVSVILRFSRVPKSFLYFYLVTLIPLLILTLFAKTFLVLG